MRSWAGDPARCALCSWPMRPQNESACRSGAAKINCLKQRVKGPWLLPQRFADSAPKSNTAATEPSSLYTEGKAYYLSRMQIKHKTNQIFTLGWGPAIRRLPNHTQTCCRWRPWFNAQNPFKNTRHWPENFPSMQKAPDSIPMTTKKVIMIVIAWMYQNKEGKIQASR